MMMSTTTTADDDFLVVEPRQSAEAARQHKASLELALQQVLATVANLQAQVDRQTAQMDQQTAEMAQLQTVNRGHVQEMAQVLSQFSALRGAHEARASDVDRLRRERDALELQTDHLHSQAKELKARQELALQTVRTAAQDEQSQLALCLGQSQATASRLLHEARLLETCADVALDRMMASPQVSWSQQLECLHTGFRQPERFDGRFRVRVAARVLLLLATGVWESFRLNTRGQTTQTRVWRVDDTHASTDEELRLMVGTLLAASWYCAMGASSFARSLEQSPTAIRVKDAMVGWPPMTRSRVRGITTDMAVVHMGVVASLAAVVPAVRAHRQLPEPELPPSPLRELLGIRQPYEGYGVLEYWAEHGRITEIAQSLGHRDIADWALALEPACA